MVTFSLPNFFVLILFLIFICCSVLIKYLRKTKIKYTLLFVFGNLNSHSYFFLTFISQNYFYYKYTLLGFFCFNKYENIGKKVSIFAVFFLETKSENNIFEFLNFLRFRIFIFWIFAVFSDMSGQTTSKTF
jgi:hypothetical protein